MQKVVITCALTGHRKDLPLHVPRSPKEQGIAAWEAYQAGASIIHLHVRDDKGNPSYHPHDYQAALYEIKSRCPDILIEISTRGYDSHGIDREANAMISPEFWGNDPALKPDLVALNISSRNSKTGIFISGEEILIPYAASIYAAGLIPRCDVFDLGHLNKVKTLADSGILQSPLHLLLVFGSDSSADASIDDFCDLVRRLPSHYHWTALGSGSKHNVKVATLAILAGGHLRTGFEDCSYLAPGIKAKSNAELVEQLASLSRQFHRDIATPVEARRILGLPEKAKAQPSCIAA